MEGVKILSEEMIRDLTNGELAIVAAWTVISLIVISILIRKMKPTKQALIAGGLFAVLMLCVLGIICYNAYNDIHTEYTVQVDDSASFNEFMETYKIIKEKDNNVYVVKLRD